MENHTGVTRQRALRSDWRGERRALTARVEIELAEEIEAKAAAAGVSVSDYLAGVIRSSTKGARR